MISKMFGLYHKYIAHDTVNFGQILIRFYTTLSLSLFFYFYGMRFEYTDIVIYVQKTRWW